MKKINTFSFIVTEIWYFKDLWWKMGLSTNCHNKPEVLARNHIYGRNCGPDFWNTDDEVLYPRLKWSPISTSNPQAITWISTKSGYWTKTPATSRCEGGHLYQSQPAITQQRRGPPPIVLGIWPDSDINKRSTRSPMSEQVKTVFWWKQQKLLKIQGKHFWCLV